MIKIILLLLLVFGINAKSVLAQDSPSVLYVPLIGITSVPEPLSLPNGAGNVTYHYAVKNFLREFPLTEIKVTDDVCNPVEFTGGDDNNDEKLDYRETWRYICTTQLTKTTQSTATATGIANNLSAVHEAFATVVVGTDKAAPIVNIINITKVAYPLSLPAQGGDIVFTYRVNNPGVLPLSNVSVTDDRCSAMSKKLGDTNGNNLLDVTEVWVYTCKMRLTQTTTNTATVTSYANGLKATAHVTLTVTVHNPNLPDTGIELDTKLILWGILLAILLILVGLLGLTRGKTAKARGKRK